MVLSCSNQRWSTGDVKEITRTFDTSGTVFDLPDTATKVFIDIGLTNGVLPASDSIPSDGSMSAVCTPPSSDLAVLSVPTLPVPKRDISPPVATSTLALPIANPSSGSVHSNPRYLAQLLVLADSTAKDFIQQDETILVEIVRALSVRPA